MEMIPLPDGLEMGPPRPLSAHYLKSMRLVICQPDLSLVTTGKPWLASIEILKTSRFRLPIGIQCFNWYFKDTFLKSNLHCTFAILFMAIAEVFIFLLSGKWESFFQALKMCVVAYFVILVVHPLYFIGWHMRNFFRKKEKPAT